MILVTLAGADVVQLGSGVVHAQSAVGTPAGSGEATQTATSIDVEGLTRDFRRSGQVADGIEIELILASPHFFHITDRWQDAVDIGADQSVVVVLNISHHGMLAEGETIVPILRLDGRQIYIASDVIALADDGHHRSDAVVFDELPVAILDEIHTIEMIFPSGPEGIRPTFKWNTPIAMPVESLSTSSSPVASPMAVITEALPPELTRTGTVGEGTEVEITLVSAEFLRQSSEWNIVIPNDADQAAAFVVNEHHYHGAPPLVAVLRIDGEREYQPSQVKTLAEDGHHLRTSVWIFSEVSASELEGPHRLEIVLPSAADGTIDTLVWDTPLD